jgi:hypothetical protein
MKVDGLYTIKQHGLVVSMKNDVEVRHEGASLRRIRDGATWSIRGVERFCKFSGLPTIGVGEPVGLLMPDGCELAVGDEVEIVRELGEHAPM